MRSRSCNDPDSAEPNRWHWLKSSGVHHAVLKAGILFKLHLAGAFSPRTTGSLTRLAALPCERQSIARFIAAVVAGDDRTLAVHGLSLLADRPREIEGRQDPDRRPSAVAHDEMTGAFVGE